MKNTNMNDMNDDGNIIRYVILMNNPTLNYILGTTQNKSSIVEYTYVNKMGQTKINITNDCIYTSEYEAQQVIEEHLPYTYQEGLLEIVNMKHLVAYLL